MDLEQFIEYFEDWKGMENASYDGDEFTRNHFLDTLYIFDDNKLDKMYVMAGMAAFGYYFKPGKSPLLDKHFTSKQLTSMVAKAKKLKAQMKREKKKTEKKKKVTKKKKTEKKKKATKKKASSELIECQRELAKLRGDMINTFCSR
jgi:hypothetical protein